MAEPDQHDVAIGYMFNIFRWGCIAGFCLASIIAPFMLELGLTEAAIYSGIALVGFLFCTGMAGHSARRALNV